MELHDLETIIKYCDCPTHGDVRVEVLKSNGSYEYHDIKGFRIGKDGILLIVNKED